MVGTIVAGLLSSRRLCWPASSPRIREREQDHERRAPSQLGNVIHNSAVFAYNLLYNWKSQARAVGFGGVEQLKHV